MGIFAERIVQQQQTGQSAVNGDGDACCRKVRPLQ
jgi:hypothetical protein